MKRNLITIIAIIGFITSIKLTWIFYESNYNPYALNSFCTINDFIDCDGVAKTAKAVVFGVPLAIWGLILYSFIIFMNYVDRLKNIKYLGFLEVFKNRNSYIFAVGLFAFLMSMSLACISLFQIHKICILCFFTYILNLIIALIAGFKEKRADAMMADCFKDFWSAIQVKKYLVAFCAVVVAFSALLVYTSKSFVLAPHMKKLSAFENLRKTKLSAYKVDGNTLGDENAKVVAYLYTDFQCPSCLMFNTVVHKAAKELKNVKFIHVNFPLDKDCNPIMKGTQMHEGSCLLAKYNIAAGYQNKYWNMNDMLFEKKPKTEADILKYSAEIGLDIEKLKSDVYSQKVEQALKDEINLALKNNLNATPVLQMGVSIRPGLMMYDELEKLLLAAGAEKR